MSRALLVRRKIFSVVLLIMLSINSLDTNWAHAEEDSSAIEAGVYIGEEQVREYMESRGLIYNSEVLAIYTNIEETQAKIQPRIDINLDFEFEIRNPNNYRYIDTSDTLEDSTRPADRSQLAQVIQRPYLFR